MIEYRKIFNMTPTQYFMNLRVKYLEVLSEIDSYYRVYLRAIRTTYQNLLKLTFAILTLDLLCCFFFYICYHFTV